LIILVRRESELSVIEQLCSKERVVILDRFARQASVILD